jgi:hypothetical protein
MTTNPETPGVIHEGALYTLAEIQQRLQLGQAALREARRQGLRIRRIGKRGFVLGEDVIRFVKEAGK